MFHYIIYVHHVTYVYYVIYSYVYLVLLALRAVTGPGSLVT